MLPVTAAMSAAAPGGIPELAASSWRQLGMVRADFLGYLREAAGHGDLVRLRPAPGTSIVLVNHPELVREVLVAQAGSFRKSRMTARMVGKFLGDGLVLSEGDDHDAQRRIVQPMFGPRRLAACAPDLQRQADAFVAAHSGRTFGLEAAMTEVSLEGAVRLLFGQAASSSDDVTDAMRVFADSMAQRFRSLPLPDWLPTARHRRDRAAIAALDSAIAGLLAGARGDDIAGLLAQALREDRVTAASVRDQLATLYFAGHETTAKLLTWTCVLLAQHPDHAAALARELHDAGDAPLDALPLLDQTLWEALRLYPPTWVFDRETTTPVTLGGYELRSGEVLYIAPWVSHRDARLFEDPDEFRPSRFAPGWDQRIDRYGYFPFGVGARHCVGRGFALMQARIAIAALFRDHRLEFAETSPALAAEPGATLGLKADASVRLVPIPSPRTLVHSPQGPPVDA
jgi:cytochrome P450